MLSPYRDDTLPHQRDLTWATLDGLAFGAVQNICNCGWRGTPLPPEDKSTDSALAQEYRDHVTSLILSVAY